jgi:MFS family permease
MNHGARPPLSRTFLALKNPNYRLFWFGQIVSLTGTWMQNIALAWLVLRVTNSPFALGTVTTIQFAPILLFSLFGGVIADRFPKYRLLVCTQTVMMLQAAILGLLTTLGQDRLVFIYILAAVQGCANALDNPARQAFLVEMVGTQDLPNAVALNSSQFQLSRLLGPALGGVAIATIGTADCFYLNAISFLAVIGGLLAMNPSRFFAAPPARRGKMLSQVGEGLRYAVTTPEIALVVLTVGILGTFGYNFSVFWPLVARYVLHTGAVGFGVLSSTVAIGSLVATLGIAYSGLATRRALLLGAAGFSVLLLGVAVSHWWLVTIPLLLALGFASSVFTATSNSRLQLVTPAHLRGRVMSIYTLLFMGSTPIGSLIVGTLAQHQSVSLTIAEMAAVCMLGAVAAFVYVRRNRHRLLPDSSTPAQGVEPARQPMALAAADGREGEHATG